MKHRREGTGGREKKMGGMEELGRLETRGNKKVHQIFTGVCSTASGKIDAPCHLDVIRFGYAEFKADVVKNVEKW